MTTVNSLPNELLQTIFIQCLPPLSIDADLGRLNALDLTPVYLSHVCRHWFQAATRFPLLWCRIALMLNGEDHPHNIHNMKINSSKRYQDIRPKVQSGRSRVYFTSLFLQNSGTLQELDVTILPSINMPSFLSHFDKLCMDRILAAASRIKKFRYDTYYIPIALSHLRTPLPVLEQLELAGPMGPSMSSSTAWFMGAPNLEEVVLEASPTKFTLPWQQIYRFTLCGPGLTGDLDFMSGSLSALKELTIGGRVWQMPCQGRHLFPHLRKLTIKIDHSKDEVGTFLNAVDLPSLTEFAMIESDSLFSDESFGTWAPEFEQMVARSSCKVTSLFLDCNHLEEELFVVLRAVPLLVTLQTSCVGTSQALFRAMAEQDDSRNWRWSPRLRLLTLELVDENEDLVKMMGKRHFKTVRRLDNGGPTAKQRLYVYLSSQHVA